MSVLTEQISKKIQQTLKYINSSICNLSQNSLYLNFFSPTVLKQRKKLLRRLYPLNELINLSPVGFQTTVLYIYIYTAELRAILLALQHVYCFKGKSFFILCNSLSALKSIINLMYGDPILVQILELYAEMTRDGREIVFIWVPGHVGIRGNSAAVSAGKDALVGDISDEVIPFSDLKSRTNKYILELWQSDWDELPVNKLHQIFSVLKECIVCSRTNRKEETVTARLHTGHFFVCYLFLYIEE